MEDLQCPFGIMPVACCQGVFSKGYGSEGFREDITAFAERFPLCRHLKVQMPICIEAMILDEVDGRPGGIEPYRILFYIVVCEGTDECPPSLEPYRLGGVHQRSVTVEAGVDSAVLSVPSMVQPERHNVVCQVVPVGLGP